MDRERELRRRESIEERMERSLVRIRAEMPEQIAHVLITEKPWFFDLPVLGAIPERRSAWWVPRYDSVTGAVYTTRWDEPSIEITSEGKQKVVGAEGFVVLRQPGYRRHIDLTALPKSWKVARFVPQEVWGGIETAMRQQDEIRRDFGAGVGVEHRQVEELFVAMRGLSQKYIRREVSRENLQDLAGQTQILLEKEGILSAKGPFLQELREVLTLVFQEDSLGRFNPLVARMRIYRAMRNLAKREVETWLTRRKSKKVFNLLYVEREDERSSLSDAREGIAELVMHPVFTESLFRSRPESIFDEDITEIRRILKAIGETLQSVRVAPYLLPARLADAMLRSNQLRTRWEKKRLKEILEIGNMENEMEKLSVEELIMKRSSFETARKLHHVYNLLDSVLKDKDNLVFTL